MIYCTVYAVIRMVIYAGCGHRMVLVVCYHASKLFNFNRFEDLKHEVELVKYILKEARLQNRITIKVSAINMKESVFQKLSMFPRQSKTCLPTVDRGL